MKDKIQMPQPCLLKAGRPLQAPHGMPHMLWVCVRERESLYARQLC